MLLGRTKDTRKLHPFVLMLITVSTLLLFLFYSQKHFFDPNTGWVLGTKSVRTQYPSMHQDVLTNYVEKRSNDQVVSAQYPFFGIESIDQELQEFVDNQVERGLNNIEYPNYLIDYRMGASNQRILSFVIITPDQSYGFVYDRNSAEPILSTNWVIDGDELILDFVRFSGLDIYNELISSSTNYYLNSDYELVFLDAELPKIVDIFAISDVFSPLVSELIDDMENRSQEYANNLQKSRSLSQVTYLESLSNFQDNIDCTAQSCIALTFDGGPNEQLIENINTLNNYNVKGTFYLIGKDIFNKTDIFNQLLNQGHEIGNATWSHPDLLTVDDQQLEEEFDRAQEIIWNQSGIWAPTFRAPFGNFDESKSDLVDSRIITWDVDSRDWELEDPNQIASLVTNQVQPGDVVLMHSLNQSTTNSLPQIIETLQSRGYKLVTVSQL